VADVGDQMRADSRFQRRAHLLRGERHVIQAFAGECVEGVRDRGRDERVADFTQPGWWRVELRGSEPFSAKASMANREPKWIRRGRHRHVGRTLGNAVPLHESEVY
jgi:hypothetical protein